MGSHRQDSQSALTRGTCVIDKVIQQGEAWRVCLHGVYWNALATHPVKLNPGDRIQVLGCVQNTNKLLLKTSK
jgi:hypothetical protein